MERFERALSDLGRHVAAEQDARAEARSLPPSGRAAFLSLAETPARAAPRRLPWARLGVALAATVALALSLVLWRVSPAPLVFEVGSLEPGQVGAWLAAPSGAELPLRFSDGSLLRLAPEGRARVVALHAEGAEVALERGVLALSVVHREGTHWRVHGGPFSIQVIGTRFTTGWDPSTEQLEVVLQEGAIEVSGPVVGARRALRAGERLRVDVAKGTLDVGLLATDEPERPSTHDSPAPPVAPASTPLASSLPAPRSATSPHLPAPPSARGPESAPAASAEPARWQVLFRDAKYAEALAAAEADGFDALCASASAGDVAALADVARLGGSAARSGQALSALRERFPGSPEAASAAFLLGRAAQDRYRDPAGAVQWFERYLAEAPGGPLAAEARGRLVELKDRMGDTAGARAAAERYLERYPDGPHGAFARSVLAAGADAAP